MQDDVLKDTSYVTRHSQLDVLYATGAVLHVNTKLMEVTDTGIRAECNGEEQFIEADHVVLAVGYRNRSTLYEELQDLGGGGLPDRRFPADKEDCGCGKRRLPHRTEYLRKYGVC